MSTQERHALRRMKDATGIVVATHEGEHGWTPGHRAVGIVDSRAYRNPSAPHDMHILGAEPMTEVQKERMIAFERERAGVVYILQARGTKYVKIGYTIDLKMRLAAYQSHNFDGFHVLAIITAAATLEKDLHKRFADLLVAGSQEWFFPGKPIIDFIRENEA